MNINLYNPYTPIFTTDYNSQPPDEFGIVDRYFLAGRQIVFSMDTFDLSNDTTDYQILSMLNGGMEGYYQILVYNQKNNALELVTDILQIFAQCKLHHSYHDPTYTTKLVVFHFPVDNGKNYDDFDHMDMDRYIFQASWKDEIT
jgi:hypothetical protein